jgi:hypothetical protein
MLSPFTAYFLSCSQRVIRILSIIVFSEKAESFQTLPFCVYAKPTIARASVTSYQTLIEYLKPGTPIYLA